MKREFTALAAAALVLTAVSCGSTDDSSSVSVKVGNTTSASTETTGESTTEATTEAKTTEAKTTESATTEEKTTEAATEEQTTEEATEEETEIASETEVQTTEEATEAAASTVIDGRAYLGCVIQDMQDLLGVQKTAYTAESCLPVGDNSNLYIYDFEGVVAECYIESEEFYVATVKLTSDAYSTPEGVRPGSSKADVEAAYASAEVQGNGDIACMNDNYTLYFVMDGDTVSEVWYSLKF